MHLQMRIDAQNCVSFEIASLNEPWSLLRGHFTLVQFRDSIPFVGKRLIYPVSILEKVQKIVNPNIDRKWIS